MITKTKAVFQYEGTLNDCSRAKMTTRVAASICLTEVPPHLQRLCYFKRYVMV